MPKKNSKKKVIQKEDPWPKISILTPIYNRNIWLPLMICNLENFDYPPEQIEWCILDSKDGDEEVKLLENQMIVDLLQKRLGKIKLNYQYIDRKMTIAEKRTYLAKNIINLDIQNLMICVCHNNNTCSKEMFKEANVQDSTLQGSHVDVVRAVMATEIANGFKDNAPFKKEGD